MNFDVSFMIHEAFPAAISGIPVSLYVTFGSMLIALPISFLFAMVRFKKTIVFSQIVQVIVSFLRGTPLVVQLFIVYSGFPSVLNIFVKNYGLEFDAFGISPYVFAFVVFSLNTMASLTEVFRSSLAAVGREQTEAGYSVGLNGFQIAVLIVIPQALVSAIPNICNEFLNLFKSTSLVYLMTIQDITGKVRLAAANGYDYTEAYVVIFIIYLILGFTMEKLFKKLEDRLKTFRARPQL